MSVASGTQRRPASSALPPRLDLALAAAFVVLVIVEALLDGGPRPLWVHLPVAVLAMAALAWRRRFPFAVALAVIAANLIVNPRRPVLDPAVPGAGLLHPRGQDTAEPFPRSGA